MKILSLLLSVIAIHLSIYSGAQEITRNASGEVEYQNDREISGRIVEEAERLIEKNKIKLAPDKAEKQLAASINKKTNISPLPAGNTPLTKEGIFEMVKQSTVIFATAYNCGKCDLTHIMPSTGYVIDPNGICVTNYHVIESYTESPDRNLALIVQSSDGNVYPVVEILASSKTNDLAIVKLDLNGHKLPALPIGEPAEIGSDVFVVSHPNNMFYYFSEGIVARNHVRKYRNGNQNYQMAITADYARGSSGGPVVDKHGNLIGTVSSTRSIYYGAQDQSNLQMVVKNTIPVIALKQLLKKDKNSK